MYFCKMSKPNILICNDDGITAPGIQNLTEAVKSFGHLTIVAPDSPQSGMGHAISVGKPLRLYESQLAHGRTGWACSGTPVDCVKLATGVLLKEKPDLLVSGINHGANSSISVVYSGTMSAAMEGAIEGIPSIGFSLALSGMMMPVAVLASPSMRFTKMRSCNGLIFISSSSLENR
jgi:5'-nucleotidase